MLNGSLGVLFGTHDCDAREDWVVWEGFDDRTIDVEAILKQQDGCVAAGDGWGNDIYNRWRHILHILGSDHHEVEGLHRLTVDLGNLVDDYNKFDQLCVNLKYSGGRFRVEWESQSNILLVGFQPLISPCSMDLMVKPCFSTIGKLERRTAVTLALPPFSRAKAAMVPMAPVPTRRTLDLLVVVEVGMFVGCAVVD